MQSSQQSRFLFRSTIITLFCLHQEPQVSLDSLASLVHQEGRVIQESQEADCLALLDLKVSSSLSATFDLCSSTLLFWL